MARGHRRSLRARRIDPQPAVSASFRENRRTSRKKTGNVALTMSPFLRRDPNRKNKDLAASTESRNSSDQIRPDLDRSADPSKLYVRRGYGTSAGDRATHPVHIRQEPRNPGAVGLTGHGQLSGGCQLRGSSRESSRTQSCRQSAKHFGIRREDRSVVIASISQPVPAAAHMSACRSAAAEHQAQVGNQMKRRRLLVPHHRRRRRTCARPHPVASARSTQHHTSAAAA
jgi:hypothetical protein